MTKTMFDRPSRFDSETVCHCGRDYAGSDHCDICGCEQYESMECTYYVSFYVDFYSNACRNIADCRNAIMLWQWFFETNVNIGYVDSRQWRAIQRVKAARIVMDAMQTMVKG